MRYTARQGGGVLAETATEYLKNEIVGNANKPGLALLLAVKQDFPTEWHRFVTGTENFKATVKRAHFPYFTQGYQIRIHQVYLPGAMTPSLTPQNLGFQAFPVLEKGDGSFQLSLGSDIVDRKDAAPSILLSYSLITS
jgi:hypothetical protein